MLKGSIVPHLVRMASPSQRNDQEGSSGVLRWAPEKGVELLCTKT